PRGGGRRPHHISAHPSQQPSAGAGASTTSPLQRPPNASARAATKAPNHLARQPLLAVAFSGTDGPDRGEGSGPVDGIESPPAEVVLVRLASAVRRYPPGCGRGIAVPNAGAPAGQGGLKAQSALRNGEAKAIASGDCKVVVVGADSNGWMNCGGDAGGAEEEGCERHWNMTGIMLPPFQSWAQHGRRLQRRKLL
uniref:Uncharacterized protein n=1 Tax=Oryza brachyantha TaxID=4533 RepID=J3MBA1_ORYBR